MNHLKTTYLIVCGVVFVLFGFLLYPSAVTLDSRWDTHHEAYSHGYYLLLAAVILTIRQLKVIKTLPPKPYPPALLPLAICCLGWLIAHIGNIRVGEQLMLPAISLSLVFLLTGKEIGKALTFPFLLIYNVIPIWDILNPALQFMTSTVSSNLLELFGIAVYIDGNQITIPAGNFIVASGCSGLNYLLMCVFLSLIYNHLYLNKFKDQLILFIAGIATGILCNWTRVTLIIVIGQITEMQSSVIKDHENLGLIIFGLCTLPLMLLGRYLEDKSDKTPIHRPPKTTTQLHWFIWPGIASLVIFITNTWHANTATYNHYDQLSQQITQRFQTLNLTPTSISTPWGPHIQKADITLYMKKSSLTHPMKISLHTFMTETQGKELIYDQNTLFSDKEWKALGTEFIQTPKHNTVALTTIKHRLLNKTFQIIHWYQIGTTRTAVKKWVKPLQIIQSLQHNQGASLITLSEQCYKSCSKPDNEKLTLTDKISGQYLLAITSMP